MVAGHHLAVHRKDDEREDHIVAWLAEGLREGAAVVCHLTDLVQAERLVRHLVDRGVDPVPLNGGLLSVVTAEEPPQRLLAAARECLRDGFPAVRLCSDARLLRSHHATCWLEQDRRLDRLSRTEPVSVLCVDDDTLLESPELGDIAALHDTVANDCARFSRHLRALEIGGEIDLANDRLFEAVVRGVASMADAGTLWLDLSGVDFMSASTYRAIVRATEGFRERGGQLRLAGSPSHVEQLLRILGAEKQPNLVLVPDPC